MKEKKKKVQPSSRSNQTKIIRKYTEQPPSFIPEWLKESITPSEEALLAFDSDNTPYLISQQSASWLRWLPHDEVGSITFDPNNPFLHDVRMLLEQARKEKKTITGELSVTDDTHNEYMVEVKMIPVFEGDSFSGAVCFLRNRKITRGKGRPVGLKKNKLLEAQRIAHIGDWENDVKANSVIWSEETYRIFGYVPGEKSPQEIFNDHLHPDDREAYWENIKKCLSSGQAIIPDYEFRIINKQGEIRYCVARGEFQFDETGKPYYAFGTIQDITESTILNPDPSLEI